MHKQAGRRLPARETFFVISIINNSGRKKPRQRTKKMEAFVTTGLVLKETRYKESDRILTILTPELGVISGSSAEQPAAKEQAVQRVRAVLLFRVHTGAGPRTCTLCGKRK